MNSLEYEAGAFAYRKGKPATDNPYRYAPVNTPEFLKGASWANGWRRAQYEDTGG